GEDGIGATRLAAQRLLTRRAPAAPAAAAHAPGDVAHVDRREQRAVHAVGDDAAELGAELLAEALHPFTHASIWRRCSARHRPSLVVNDALPKGPRSLTAHHTGGPFVVKGPRQFE